MSQSREEIQDDLDELEPEELSEELPEDEPETPDTDEETEAKAHRMGWVPKDKYRGDPKRWVSAEEFVSKGENELPILRDQLRRQDKTIAEMQETFKEFGEYHTKTVQKQYQKALTDLIAQQREAVESADVELFDQTQERMRSLQDEYREAPKVTPQVNPVYTDWKSENEWYGTDTKMTRFANTMAEDVAEDRPDLVGTEGFLVEVKARVAKQYPDKFRNVQRDAAPTVETGGTVTRGRKTSYANLPASAKAECDRYVKHGLGTREQYIADYEE